MSTRVYEVPGGECVIGSDEQGWWNATFADHDAALVGRLIGIDRAEDLFTASGGSALTVEDLADSLKAALPLRLCWNRASR